MHVPSLLEELEMLRAAGIDYQGRILISDRAHLVFDFHQMIDGLNESKLSKEGAKLGTTLKGIGPSYGSKIARTGLRIGDLKDMQYFEVRLRRLIGQANSQYPDLCASADRELSYYWKVRDQVTPMISDTAFFVNRQLDAGRKVLVEGANAVMIDIDFGTYPYVTSSNPSVGSVCTGLGVPPQHVGEVTGIVKAYCTRVGEGPFPTELSGALDDKLRRAGQEFGTTTGRPRRCGWIDIPQLRYAKMINGFTNINLTKVDILTGFDAIKIGVQYRNLKTNEIIADRVPADLKEYSEYAVEYETMPGWQDDISNIRDFDKLPENCRNYILRLEELIGVPVRWIGVGSGREDVIER